MDRRIADACPVERHEGRGHGRALGVGAEARAEALALPPEPREELPATCVIAPPSRRGEGRSRRVSRLAGRAAPPRGLGGCRRSAALAGWGCFAELALAGLVNPIEARRGCGEPSEHESQAHREEQGEAPSGDLPSFLRGARCELERHVTRQRAIPVTQPASSGRMEPARAEAATQRSTSLARPPRSSSSLETVDQ